MHEGNAIRPFFLVVAVMLEVVVPLYLISNLFLVQLMTELFNGLFVIHLSNIEYTDWILLN